jgi:hypothetical protein
MTNAPKPAICLFMSTEHTDLESALIRRFSMCDWSHTGFYRLSDGCTFSAMNDGKGVAWRPPNPNVKILLLTAPRVDEAFAWALQQQGKPYDRLDIEGFLFDRDWSSPNSLICDRLVFLSFVNLLPSQPLLNHTFIPIIHLIPRDVLLSPLVTEFHV